MSKVSRRPGREERKCEKRTRKQAAQELRQRQAAEGLESRPKTTISNGKSAYKTVEEEQQARQEAVEEQLQPIVPSCHLVEAAGEDPRPTESENDPTQIDGVAAVRDTPVCLPDGLATRS